MLVDVEGDREHAGGFDVRLDLFDRCLAALLEEHAVDNGIDIWEPLPQTLFLGSDILLYGYNYTYFDINFFLDGTVDPTGLDPIYTDGLIFRVAIIPADFAETLDLTDMNLLMDALQIEAVTKVRQEM